jgi:hypothetical protein
MKLRRGASGGNAMTPPGPPPIEAKVIFNGVALTEDEDDGPAPINDAEILVKVTVTATPNECGTPVTHEYPKIWDCGFGGLTYLENILVHAHLECTPRTNIEVAVTVVETEFTKAERILTTLSSSDWACYLTDQELL